MNEPPRTSNKTVILRPKAEESKHGSFALLRMTLVLLGALRRFLEIVTVAVIYYAAARLGLLLAFQNTNASPVWPPSGFAFAAILVLGYRVWPGIAIGAFAANVAVFAGNHAADIRTILPVSLLIAMGNTFEAVSGRYLFHRMTSSSSPAMHIEDVFKFVLAAFLMCLVSAIVGPTSICLLGVVPWTIYRTMGFTWWLGDVAGVIVLTPVLLAWRNLRPAGGRPRH